MRYRAETFLVFGKYAVSRFYCVLSIRRSGRKDQVMGEGTRSWLTFITSEFTSDTFRIRVYIGGQKSIIFSVWLRSTR